MEYGCVKYIAYKSYFRVNPFEIKTWFAVDWFLYIYQQYISQSTHKVRALCCVLL